MTQADLLTKVWGPEYGDAIDSLKLYIHYLRQKVEQDPQRPEYILTGNQSLLKQYYDHKPAVNAQVAELKAATADSPRQRMSAPSRRIG